MVRYFFSVSRVMPHWREDGYGRNTLFVCMEFVLIVRILRGIMMEKMIRLVKQQLEQWTAWQEAKTVVVAVSGGVDSMVLWHVMQEIMELQDYRSKRLVIAHFNHQLRQESDEEAQYIKQLAEQRGVIYVMKEWDQPVEQESLARAARYEFFAEVVQLVEADILMTAHHLNDAAETFLMRITRGTSLKGLRGIQSCYQRLLVDQRGKAVLPYLMRPLLSVTRIDIEKYATQHAIEYYTDSSNTNRRYMRNRFRQEFIPKFLDENPQFLHNVLTLQMQVQDAYKLGFDQYLAIEPRLLMYSVRHYWLLYIPEFRKLEESAQRMYLQYFFEERLIEEIPHYRKEVIGQLLQMMRNQRHPNQRLQLGNGWVAIKRYDYIQLLPETSLEQMATEQPFGGKVELSRLNTWYSVGEGMEAGIFPAYHVHENQKLEALAVIGLYLNADEINQPLPYVLRHRQDGDVLTFIDGSGQLKRKKVSRLLMDAKIPLDKRDQVWLLQDSEHSLIWMGPNPAFQLFQAVQPDKISHIFILRKNKD